MRGKTGPGEKQARTSFAKLATELRTLAKKEKRGLIDQAEFLNLYQSTIRSFVKKYGPKLISGRRPKRLRGRRGGKSLRSKFFSKFRQTAAPPVQGGLPSLGKRT